VQPTVIPTGSPTNPSRSEATNPQRTDADMRSAVYGNGLDIFNPAVARQLGGGVHAKPKRGQAAP